MAKAKNLMGQKFDRLTVIGKCKDVHGHLAWICKCDCGNEVVSHSYNLLKKSIYSSCGCYNSDYHKTHGLSKTREYKCYRSMINRCCVSTSQDYSNYGGRGITVCDRWKESFINFYNDMGKRPGSGYSIDRIDVNGNYCKENCRWTTMEVQNNNRRSNKLVEYKGDIYTVSELSKKLKMNYQTLKSRLKRGLSDNELSGSLDMSKKRDMKHPKELTIFCNTKKITEWGNSLVVKQRTLYTWYAKYGRNKTESMVEQAIAEVFL